MKWLLIWICGCQQDVQVVYGAHTEENCELAREELHERVGGAYMCAQMADFFEQDSVVLWGNHEKRIRVITRAQAEGA